MAKKITNKKSTFIPYQPQVPYIAPSILSADFANLKEEIAQVEEGGADWLHLDVMDGHFVPNLTFGPPVVKAISKVTQLPLDCHLMVSQPENWITAFAEAGAFGITIHAEAAVHLHRQIARIKEVGCRAGVSLNPATPLTAIEEILGEVDLVLVMSVNPGFGGQKFITQILKKIDRLSTIRARFGAKFRIEVDGGVTIKNIGSLYKAGADTFVVGSSVFDEKDRAKAIFQLKKNLKTEGV